MLRKKLKGGRLERGFNNIHIMGHVQKDLREICPRVVGWGIL